MDKLNANRNNESDNIYFIGAVPEKTQDFTGNIFNAAGAEEEKSESNFGKKPHIAGGANTDKAVGIRGKYARKRIQTAFISFFAVFILFFIVAGLASPQKTYSEAEKRPLAPAPPLNISSVLSGSFMSSLENYLSDRFFLRETAVSLKTYSGRLFGKTEINGVYVGKNRLYEVPAQYDCERTERTIKAISDFSEKCGIKNQYMLLVPNPTEILKDGLPRFLRPASQTEQIKKIYSSLPKSISGIEAAEALSRAESKDSFYLKTDHHWTSRGALCVFGEFARALGLEFSPDKFEFSVLSNSFFGTLSAAAGIYERPDVLEAVMPAGSAGSYYVYNAETKTKTISLFDLSKLGWADEYQVFLGGNFSELDIHTRNTDGKNLLIFKDSYANCFIPLLTPYFSRITVIDPRYYTDDIGKCIENNDFTHLLYLYNVNTFLRDTVLKDVL